MACGYKSSGHLISSSFSVSRLQLDKSPRKTIIGFSSDNPIDRRPIKWTCDRMKFVRDFFEGRSYPYRYLDFSSTFDDWGREIQLFAIALDANRESGGIIPNEDIIFYSSMGPEYSKALKNYRQDCFLKKIQATSFKVSKYEHYNKFGIKNIPDIDYIDRIFPYRFCLFWEEECDDTEWYKIPVHASQKYVDTFRMTLRTMLSSLTPIDFDPRFEVLNELSKSKSLSESKREPLVMRKYRGKNIENYFSTSFSPCERSVIPVYPCGYRDAVITTPEDSSTIRMIERVVSKILEDLPYHLYNKDPLEIFDELADKVNANQSTFICRDIAKEGITKPRYLLRICLEELSKVAPILSNYIGFYDTFSVKDLETCRGHGLGMANALTTIVQIVVSAMINQELSNSGYDTSSNHYFAFNDDYCCIIPDDMVDEYWSIEGDIFEGLSLIRREDKSFFSTKGLVFCEIYVRKEDRGFAEKKLSLTRTILLSFAFDYIYEAKDYINSLSGQYDQSLEKYMEEILTFWGYEFFPEEYQYPYLFGGWRSEKFLGYSIELKFLEDLEYDSRVYGAYMASKVRPFVRRKKDRYKFSSIWNRLIIPDTTLERVCPVGSDEHIKNKYRLYHQFKETSAVARYNVQIARINTYHEKRKVDISYDDFINLFLEENPKSIPPEKFIEWIPSDKLVSFITDPYIQDTPIRNYLSYKGEKFSYPLSGIAEDYSIGEYNTKILRPDSWNVETFHKGKYYMDTMEYMPINTLQFHIDDGEFGDLPNRIIAACKLYNNEYYPKFLVQRDPGIKEKKLRVYGELLPIEEQVDVFHGLIRKDRLRIIIEKSRQIPRDFDTMEEAEEYIASLSEPIPSCEVEDLTSSEDELDVEVGMRSVDAYITQFFSAREYINYIPEGIDYYDFIFNKDNHSLFNPKIQAAVARVKEVYTLYYHRTRNVNTDEFVSSCILRRDEEEETMNLLQGLAQQGYCRELVQIFGIDVPNEEDVDLDTEGLFFSCP